MDFPDWLEGVLFLFLATILFFQCIINRQKQKAIETLGVAVHDTSQRTNRALELATMANMRIDTRDFREPSDDEQENRGEEQE